LRTTKQYVVEPLSQNRRLIAQIYPRQQTQDREQDYNEFLPFFAAGYSLKQCCLRAWNTCLLAFDLLGMMYPVNSRLADLQYP
jgi:phosphopantetheinyl transferase (holo-ACP synthase)